MATFDAEAPWTTLPDSVKGSIRSYICHPVARLIKEFDAQREAAPHLRRLGAVQAEKRDVLEMLGHFRTLEWQYVLMRERLAEDAGLRERMEHTLLVLRSRARYEADRQTLAQREERLRARLRLCAFKGTQTFRVQIENGRWLRFSTQSVARGDYQPM
jgi:hypothetical protein